jgi:hypothetical protein
LPQQSIATAVAAARSLLRENAIGSHIADFEEDFGLYWLNHAVTGGLKAEVLISSEDCTHYGAYWLNAGTFFAFGGAILAALFLLIVDSLESSTFGSCRLPIVFQGTQVSSGT